MCVGFASVEVPLSPKSHDQLAALVERSTKETASGATPLVGLALKSAVGAGGGATLMKFDCCLVLLPEVLATVSFTV